MSTSTQYVLWNAAASATDAAVRSMMSSFYSRLESNGWTQAADTGQVDESTVTTAQITGNISTTVFQIHYFDDDLHGTAPFYLKTRWYRTGYAAGWICINYEIGTGTNGSGTITGATISPSSSSSTTYSGVTSGYLRIDTTYAENKYSGILIDVPSSSTNPGALYGGSSFFFARSVDVVTEEPNTDGAVFYTALVGDGTPYLRMHYYNGSAWTATNNYSYVPGSKSYSPPEGFAVYRHWYVAQNKYQLVPQMVTVMANELGLDQEFTVTPGSIPHQFKKLGLGWACPTYQGSSAVTNKHRPAVIWE